MATTLINVHIEQVSARKPDLADPRVLLDVLWQAQVSDTGALVETLVTTEIADPSHFLDQAAWDTIFSGGASALADATGAPAPTTNPVVIP